MIPVEGLLTPEAVAWVEGWIREFRGDWDGLLRRREELRRDPRGHLAALRAHPTPAAVQRDDWRVAPVPVRLLDRRVEITGPAADPRMAVKAASSGASGYMVDGEDSLCPTWENVLRTHSTVTGLVRGTLHGLPPVMPTLHYRPRGLHLTEEHWRVDGSAAPAALVDAGLFLYWNAREMVARGEVPALYLPKLEGEWEARWWHRALSWAEARLGLPADTVRVTVLVETLPLLFRLEETVWALRDRLAGLNVGRWDYIFSAVKVLSRSGEGRGLTLPDRSQLTMEAEGLTEYARWVVAVAHRRGCHAIGGMAAQVPSRRDPGAAAAALEAVRRDKEREVRAGHDGTWVAHPDLVRVALGAWRAHLGERTVQLDWRGSGAPLDPDRLFRLGDSHPTEAGLTEAVRTALRYWAAWLDGNGCVALDGRMEDAATAEISVALLWHWLARGATTVDRVDAVVRGETEALAASGAGPRIQEAADLILRAVIAPSITEFVLSEAYRRVVRI